MRLQNRAPYAERVRALLSREPMPHRVAMRQIARALGLSVRSLQRRLAEEERSFPALAAEVSANHAKRLLAGQRHSIQEAAHAMGFANVGSFHRAFRRWTGTTPGLFKNQS